MKNIKVGDLMVHKTTDEIIQITAIHEDEEITGMTWVSFVNDLFEIEINGEIFAGPCCSGRFPLHTESMIHEEFIKFGEI